MKYNSLQAKFSTTKKVPSTEVFEGKFRDHGDRLETSRHKTSLAFVIFIEVNPQHDIRVNMYFSSGYVCTTHDINGLVHAVRFHV